MVQEIIL